ncbi:hypothetical protein MOF25_06910 [Bacillus atrophaeus]|uniref:hypothetical protein n=1 Tax=Bacillus atrophaeus TaxID=1452 RepID=UPI002281A73F|nr:hypothetical protein [Bacillus atrophaeus]MCY9160063.1 hypothetical protein [Bacillus atrophaeus]
MDVKETVTMYQISKELALESNYDFVKKEENGDLKIIDERRNAFDNFKKEQVRKLTELLKVKGIEKNAVKNGREFAIPLYSKEYIKFLLLNFTSTPVKAIRKSGLEKLPYSQWNELINGLVEYSTKEIRNNIQKEKIRNRIFADHQYFSTERYHRLIDKFSGVLKKAELRYGAFEYLGHTNYSNKSKASGVDGFRLLNENDVMELYDYLEKKIYQCFIEFGEVADIFSEIRHEEIEDKVIKAIDEKNLLSFWRS